MTNATIDYFGKETVEQAVASYFAKHGVTPAVRDELITIAEQREDDFFELVSDFIYNKG